MDIRVGALARRVYGAAEPVVIEVAETTNARRRLKRNLLLALALLEAMLIALSAAVIWVAVGRGLAPLAALRRGIENLAYGGSKLVFGRHGASGSEPRGCVDVVCSHQRTASNN